MAPTGIFSHQPAQAIGFWATFFNMLTFALSHFLHSFRIAMELSVFGLDLLELDSNQATKRLSY